ncbi:methyl-CpG-binding domain protein 2-like [Montipora foliosa]|uniref:methyl-CpG-binding domain protein 2-like n=1 Tax=Montipora foliosa TaxID=591990 RepID=UPI0035F213DF
MDEKPIRMECSSLPSGWQREIVMRKSGLSAGRSDVYYYSPDGKKIRSKPQLEKHLPDLDLGNFDFRSGTYCRRSKRKQGEKEQSFGRDLNGGIIPAPVRQLNKSLSKQSVTYYPSMGQEAPKDKKRKLDAANTKTEKEKPKQLFWQKRLQGIPVCSVDETTIKCFRLPPQIKSVGPGINQKSLIHSLVTNLYNNSSVKGQDRSAISLEKHPEVWLNAEQPLCTPFAITDTDIKKQEEKVATLRRQLSEALAEYEHLKRDPSIK